MEDRHEASGSNAAVVFEVRHVVVKPPAKIPVVLQYVRAALETVGYGSVYASPTGLQITAPVELLVHLQATIADYNGIALSDDRFARVLYRPSIKVDNGLPKESASDTVARLGLCPWDMSYALVSYTAGTHILFAGPKDRESFYNTNIWPHLTTIFAASPPKSSQ